jgi:hypothetical protein
LVQKSVSRAKEKNPSPRQPSSLKIDDNLANTLLDMDSPYIYIYISFAVSKKANVEWKINNCGVIFIILFFGFTLLKDILHFHEQARLIYSKVSKAIIISS